jgi:hypothetical protein
MFTRLDLLRLGISFIFYKIKPPLNFRSLKFMVLLSISTCSNPFLELVSASAQLSSPAGATQHDHD